MKKAISKVFATLLIVAVLSFGNSILWVGSLKAQSTLIPVGSGGGGGNSNYSNYASSAVENSEVIKASSGRLYALIFSNGNASARYFQCANATSVPADATVPFLTIYCPASQVCAASFSDTDGLYFSTGITCWNSTTQNAKTLGTADSLFNILFK